jgi:uncharacterized RmlC-like cupin family protein
MRRQRAIDVPGLWSGVVHTEPGATSGWHHHGDHETSLYIVAGPGEFVHVPKHVVHRESNPAGETALAVIARSGSGEPTVNVRGPDAG